MTDHTPDGHTEQATEPSTSQSVVMRFVRHAILWLATLGVLAIGAGVSFYWVTHRPQAKRRPPTTQPLLVEVSPITFTNETIVLDAMGTVIPARQVVLTSRVQGEVIEMNPKFIPGGQFDANELLLRIDPSDFELAVRQQEAQATKASADVLQAQGVALQRETDVERAEAELTMEDGRRDAALGQYELLGEMIEPEDETLILREPQRKQRQADLKAASAALEAARATVESAQASEQASRVALEQARLNLERTYIHAPFNAIVRSRNTILGANVTAGASLASLVGTDQYWIELSVPIDELKWIKIPGFNSEIGSTVRIYCDDAWTADVYREGVVAQLTSDIEPEGRMARLLVAIDDPLDFQTKPSDRKPLILGSYIRVEITGQELEGIACVDRAAVHEGNQVWIMTPEGTLEIRDIEIIWAEDDYVCISGGLEAGEKLITSDLSSPVAGRPLRFIGASSARDTEQAPLPTAKGHDHE